MTKAEIIQLCNKIQQEINVTNEQATFNDAETFAHFDSFLKTSGETAAMNYLKGVVKEQRRSVRSECIEAIEVIKKELLKRSN